jgi:hypothetical protein
MPPSVDATYTEGREEGELAAESFVDLPDRADQRSRELDVVAPWVGEPSGRAGVKEHVRRRGGPPRPVELLANLCHRDF